MAQPQAAIVAVSTCHDVFETLEKRVQSRFVHSKLGVDWYSYSQEPGMKDCQQHAYDMHTTCIQHAYDMHTTQGSASLTY